MRKRSPRPRPSGRASVHLSLPPDVDARLRAYAGYHRLELSSVVAEALRSHLKGFTVRFDAPSPSSPSTVHRPPSTTGAGEGPTV